MDRNLKRHAVAPRVISRARKSPEKKKKDLRRPNCLLFSLTTLFCPFCPYNVFFVPRCVLFSFALKVKIR